MKKTTLLLFLFLFLFILTGPVSGQSPMKVGALIPFTGRWGDSGRECAKGMLDAAKWLNQRGGVFGRKLEISLIEDTSQVAETVAAFRKLNEADRVLLFYIYSMETGLALLPHIHYTRLPTLSSSFPAHLAKPSQYPYIFSIVPTPLDLSKIALKFIAERSEIKMRKPKVVFVGSSDYWGRHFLDESKEYAKTLGIDIGPDFLFSDTSSMESVLSALEAMKSHNPDFAYLSVSSKEAPSILLEGQKMGLKTKWICSMKAFDENLLSFDGVLGVQPIAPFGEDIPGMIDIKEAHRRWHPYDSHTLSYVEGWATLQVIGEVMGRSLPEYMLSRERVKSSLESLKDFVLGGLVPPLTITANDHRPSTESRILIVKDGKLLRYTGFLSVGR
jgi:branched-chain amino acid transport system substrate-binding protein